MYAAAQLTVAEAPWLFRGALGRSKRAREQLQMRKQSGYVYFQSQHREAASAAVDIDPDTNTLGARERNQAVMRKLAEMWGALDDAAKQKYKDDAPMVEVKAKKEKAPKEPKAPKPAKHLFQSKPDGKNQTSMMSFFAKKA